MFGARIARTSKRRPGKVTKHKYYDKKWLRRLFLFCILIFYYFYAIIMTSS